MRLNRPAMISRDDVLKRALEVREQFKEEARRGARPLLEAILQRYNGVVDINYSDSEEALSVGKDLKKFTIHLPSETSHVRDNFTIAHELGHFFLHSRGDDKFNRGGRDRREFEANWFAAELLMPSEEFKAAAARTQNDPHQLASHFGVSPAAAKVRLSVLGLI